MDFCSSERNVCEFGDLWDVTALLSQNAKFTNKIKEPNLGLMAFNLLEAATALAGILAQSI